jgi:hypothetical protein
MTCRLCLCVVIPFLVIATSPPRIQLVASPEATVSGISHLVMVRAGRLTVRLHEVPWAVVLRELQQQTGIAFRVQDPLPGTATGRFEGLPLENGLRRLLQNADLIFLYASEGPDSPPTQVWILPRQEGGAAEGANTSARWSQETEDDVRVMIEAGLTAESREGYEAAVESLIQALQDPDATVRERAATAVADFQDEAAVESLSKILVENAGEDVRESVVHTLGDIASSRAIEVLGRALEDQSARVREAAADAFGRIGKRRIADALKGAPGGEDRDLRATATRLIQLLTETPLGN